MIQDSAERFSLEFYPVARMPNVAAPGYNFKSKLNAIVEHAIVSYQMGFRATEGSLERCS